MLGGAGLLDIAHAAVHLDAEGRDLDTDVGAPGLGDGGQQIEARVRRGTDLGVGVAPGDVVLGRGVVADGAGCLGEDPHLHQHTPHVGMANDRNRLLPAAQRPRLNALPRMGDSPLVGPFGDGDAL